MPYTTRIDLQHSSSGKNVVLSDSQPINVLITGAGSVLGQSIFKALAISRYRGNMRVYYTNSEPDGAGFYLNSRGFYELQVAESFLVPIARDAGYLPTIREICESREIDLIFGGTEHEIFRLSELMTEHPYANKVVALPSSIVEITTDKWSTARFFERHRLAAPATTLYANLSSWLPSRSYPFVMKPRVSSASRNIFVIRKYEDFEMRRFGNPDEIIVQECIGTADDEYTVGCYLDALTHRISTIVMRRKLALDGASVSGVVVCDPQIEDYCADIVRALMDEGMESGPVNIQLRIHHGQPVCFEINGRFSSTEAARAALGFNAVEAAIANRIEHREYRGFQPRVNTGFVRYYEELFFDEATRTSLPLVTPSPEYAVS